MRITPSKSTTVHQIPYNCPTCRRRLTLFIIAVALRHCLADNPHLISYIALLPETTAWRLLSITAIDRKPLERRDSDAFHSRSGFVSVGSQLGALDVRLDTFVIETPPARHHPLKRAHTNKIFYAHYIYVVVLHLHFNVQTNELMCACVAFG